MSWTFETRKVQLVDSNGHFRHCFWKWVELKSRFHYFDTFNEHRKQKVLTANIKVKLVYEWLLYDPLKENWSASQRCALGLVINPESGTDCRHPSFGGAGSVTPPGARLLQKRRGLLFLYHAVHTKIRCCCRRCILPYYQASMYYLK